LDLILQAPLLKQALADGKFDSFEKQFADKIRNKADLLTLVNLKTNDNILLI